MCGVDLRGFLLPEFRNLRKFYATAFTLEGLCTFFDAIMQERTLL
jgi:hypothetical protein